MLEDVYYLQNSLLQSGISTAQFDDSNYFEMLEGMSARPREDRPKSLEDFLGAMMG